MRRPLNLWLLLIALVCAASIWAGSGRRLPFRGNGSAGAPTGRQRYDSVAESEAEPAVHLQILNGTSESGLARRVGLLAAGAGCVAENVGNAPAGRYPVCLLINRRLDRKRAEELAARLGGVKLLREWDARTTEDAVLVLGDDYRSLIEALER